MRHPPEVLCLIFHYTVEGFGIRRLLPLLHVCRRWRLSALGDSSLWTTIHLSNANPPLLDMIIAHSGKRMLKVHLDYPPDTSRRAELRGLLERIEELNCSYWTSDLPSFLYSLSPAPNLKILRFSVEGQNDYTFGPRRLSLIFQGYLPSLRELSFGVAVTWPVGLFKGLRSLELGVDPEDLLHLPPLLDALRGSPLLENLHVAGSFLLPRRKPPAIHLPFLRNCTLIGEEPPSIIWCMDIPPTTNVSLNTPMVSDITAGIYPPKDLCSVPHIHVLDGVSTISFSIELNTIQFGVQNISGGVLHAQVCYHDDVVAALTPIVGLLQNSGGSRFEHRTAKEFSLYIDRGAAHDDPEWFDCPVIFTKLISGIPSLEKITLRGISDRALSFFFRYPLYGGNTTMSYPNLRQLHVESTPLQFPRAFLKNLDIILRARRRSGVPLRIVHVEVVCETPTPVGEHLENLAAWEGLVAEDIKVDYFRGEVEKPSSRELRPFYGDYEEDSIAECIWDAFESGGNDSDWEDWVSGSWPKAASELRQWSGKVPLLRTAYNRQPEISGVL